MSLSDSCLDTISDLADAIHAYSPRNHSLHYWNSVINSMFTLAEVAAELNLHPMMEGKRSVHWIANRLVLDALLNEEKYGAKLYLIFPLLAQIAKQSPRLSGAIIEIYKWSKTPEGIEDFMRCGTKIPVKPLFDDLYPSAELDTEN